MQSIFDILSTNNQQHSKKFQKEKLSRIDIFFTLSKLLFQENILFNFKSGPINIIVFLLGKGARNFMSNYQFFLTHKNFNGFSCNN